MSKSSVVYAMATLLVLLLTFAIDTLFLQNKAAQSEDKPLEQTQAKRAEAQPSFTMVTQMSMVDVSLPAPPVLQTETVNLDESSVNEKLLQNVDSEKALKTPIYPTSAVKPKVFDDRRSQQNVPVPSQHQISQRLSQLVALNGIDRTLYFPESNKREILKYMHTCVGIDVGAVNNHKLTLFSHKNTQHSQIVRAANGFKTPHELALLAAYAPNQRLVRLYPKWFDERLGAEIAASLGQQSLRQLSGQYALKEQSLWLTKVKLNHNVIDKEWLLARGC